MPSSPPLGRIHLIADLDVLSEFDDGMERIRELLAAGLPSLSLRGRGRSVDELVRLGEPLRAEARLHGAMFVVNGPHEAVTRLNADGWHLPAAAAPPPADLDRPWGRSVHDAHELGSAEGASWVFLSPVFPTRSKPGTDGLGLPRFTELTRSTSIPVYALGGVDRGNSRACHAAGAGGVAAIRALLGVGGRDWVRDLVGTLPG